MFSKVINSDFVTIINSDFVVFGTAILSHKPLYFNTPLFQKNPLLNRLVVEK